MAQAISGNSMKRTLPLLGEGMIIAVIGALLLPMIAADAAGVLAIPRLILGIFVTLILPGYFLQAALFPAASSIDGPARAAISVGGSMTLYPPLALLLDYAPGLDLSQDVIVVAQSLMILGLAGASWVRRRQLPADERFQLGVNVQPGLWWRNEDLAGRAAYSMIGLSAIIALIAALGIIFTPTPSQNFTEFYMLGQDGLASNFPRAVNADDPFTLRTGVINREGVAATYRMEVHEGDTVIAEAGPYDLASMEEQIVDLELTLTTPADETRLDILLFRDRLETPYRELALWLEVRDASGGI